MINLEIPSKLKPFVSQAHEVAEHVLRPISRKYDIAEHTYPKELDMLAALVDGMNEGSDNGAGATGVRRAPVDADGASASGGKASSSKAKDSQASGGKASTGNGRGGASSEQANRNGTNLATVLGIIEMCWGDVGLLLSMPRQGLGNSAIASVATEEQLRRYDGKWAAMAITEPEAGSDSAAIKTTAKLDGDEYVLNGEKIFVTSGERADLVVVWATLDRQQGRAAIKSFIVERSNPGLKLERLEHKLGIKASDTANFRLEDCRVSKDALLGSAEIDVKQGFGGAMQTFDNTRPLVAGMAVGVGKAALDETKSRLRDAGIEIDSVTPAYCQHAASARFLELEADWEAARLLTLRAAWMADNGKPNSLQASIAKAKAGRVCVDVTLGCVELCGSLGYGENELLEKWARDAKILDIFEGTQQIQLLVVARQLLSKTSAELR